MNEKISDDLKKLGEISKKIAESAVELDNTYKKIQKECFGGKTFKNVLLEISGAAGTTAAGTVLASKLAKCSQLATQVALKEAALTSGINGVTSAAGTAAGISEGMAAALAPEVAAELGVSTAAGAAGISEGMAAALAPEVAAELGVSTAAGAAGTTAAGTAGTAVAAAGTPALFAIAAIVGGFFLGTIIGDKIFGDSKLDPLFDKINGTIKFKERMEEFGNSVLKLKADIAYLEIGIRFIENGISPSKEDLDKALKKLEDQKYPQITERRERIKKRKNELTGIYKTINAIRKELGEYQKVLNIIK